MENSLLYNAKIKTYPNGTRKITLFNQVVYNPDKILVLQDIWRVESLKRTLAEKKQKEIEQGFVELVERRPDNMKRSKDKIFDIAYANSDIWTHMVTLTLDPQKIDRNNPYEVSKKVGQWLKNQVKRKDLNYLVIPEPHKKGGIHFHGLICGNLKFVDSGHKDKHGRKIFNVSDFPYGFTTAVELETSTQLYVCKYITKYVTKGMLDVMPKSFYAGGKDLRREPECTYALLDFNQEFTDVEIHDVPNSGMKVKYITLGEL